MSTIPISTALHQLLQKQTLSPVLMREVMHSILSGKATSAQIAGFLVALRAKGESVQEVVSAVQVLREWCTSLEVNAPYLVDTCGTGGDGTHTFNVSTASAFVAAAAGCHVAKHGGRSVSSRTGSADVLEEAGIVLHLPPECVKMCIEEVGIGFLFAQDYHSAMKHVGTVRRELGTRTLFNLVGPLTNPAHVPHQVMGVYSIEWLHPLAEILRELGSQHVLVVHAEDGLDEMSLGATTHVAELHNGSIETYTVTPEQFGLKRANLGELVVSTAEESLHLIKKIFSGVSGPARDIVLLNAGATIYVAGVADSIESGIQRAAVAIDTGCAKDKLEELVSFSKNLVLSYNIDKK